MAKGRVQLLRQIIKDGQHRKIEGIDIDLQTANMLLTIYKSLKPKNKKKFNKIPLSVLIDFGWKHVEVK